MVGREQISAFSLGNESEVRLPGVWKKDRRAALVEPIDFLFSQEKDTPKDEFGDAVGMRLGIGERKSRTPGPAEYLPPLDAEVLTDFLDVADQVPCGVVLQGRVRRAFAAAALIEVDNAVLRGMKKAPLLGLGAAAWSPMQEHDRLAGRIAAFLKVDFVDGGNSEQPRVVRFYRRIEP